jgi:hypothetical protein
MSTAPPKFAFLTARCLPTSAAEGRYPRSRDAGTLIATAGHVVRRECLTMIEAMRVGEGNVLYKDGPWSDGTA